jgi:hypothetical protein
MYKVLPESNSSISIFIVKRLPSGESDAPLAHAWTVVTIVLVRLLPVASGRFLSPSSGSVNGVGA